MREVTELRRQLEVLQLRVENRQLLDEKSTGLRLEVAKKSRGLSIYGLQRFPVTLFKEQWLRILGASEAIRKFIGDQRWSAELEERRRGQWRSPAEQAKDGPIGDRP